MKKVYMKINLEDVLKDVVSTKGLEGGASASLVMMFGILQKVAKRVVNIYDKELLAYMLQLGLVNPINGENVDALISSFLKDEPKQDKEFGKQMCKELNNNKKGLNFESPNLQGVDDE